MMINKEMVRNKLYEEFIRPTNQNKNFIGIEIEIPIINLDKKAVDFNVVHEITGKFQGSSVISKQTVSIMTGMYFP